MRLGKTAWTLMGIGAFFVLAAGLGVARTQESQEQVRMKEQLSVAEASLLNRPSALSTDELLAQKSELENRLAASRSRLEDIKARLRQPVESIEVTDAMYRVADTSDVEILTISSPGPSSSKLGGGSLSTISLTADVKGDVDSLIAFISRLSEEFPTGVLESVKMAVPVLSEGDGGAGGNGETGAGKPSASLVLRVYGYDGD